MTRRDLARISAAFGTSVSSILALDSAVDAPRFKAKDLAGKTFDNESLKGKVVLIQFWATWCKFCRLDQSAVDDVTAQFKDQGLVVLAVNIAESKKKVEAYLENSPRACHVVLTPDTNLAAALGSGGLPKYVVINRRGKLVKEQQGAGGIGALHILLSAAGLNPGA